MASLLNHVPDYECSESTPSSDHATVAWAVDSDTGSFADPIDVFHFAALQDDGGGGIESPSLHLLSFYVR